MIQRVQSIYLLIAGIFPAITLFCSVMSFVDVKGTWMLSMASCGYNSAPAQLMTGRMPYGLIVFATLAALDAIFAIFCFKDRKSQLRKVNVAIMMNLLWYVALVGYTWSISNRLGLTFSFDICAVAPLLAILSLLLAKRAIRKDEALVRAADRIR